MIPKVVGLIGGMGPEATIDLMQKIIRATPAKADQEHIRLLVDSNPQVPCRVKAILGNGPNPGPVMAKMAKGLEMMGAEILAIPCNTAHYYLEYVKNIVNIPVVNIIEETVNVLVKDKVKDVALIASTALLKTKLYQNQINRAGINLILPTEKYQQMIMETIFAVKSANFVKAKKCYDEINSYINNMGAKSVILGCTELPLIIKEGNYSCKFYDPTKILALAIVDYCFYLR